MSSIASTVAEGEKPPQEWLEAFNMRRSGLEYVRIASIMSVNGKKYSTDQAMEMCNSYIKWAREEVRKKEEEARDFKLFSLFDIVWSSKKITCPLEHKDKAFKNPVYISPGKKDDSEILDMVAAMREHGRTHHFL